MAQNLGCVALVVCDCDEAIAFFTQTLGFTLFEDTDLGHGKRWVLVGPLNSRGTSLRWRARLLRNKPAELEIKPAVRSVFSTH
jgi:catechol 2,3-dioxygenase-like lactoylglutathione lyase family enzyme